VNRLSANDFTYSPKWAEAEDEAMLMTLAVILLVLWLLGIVTGYTVSAFIHVLLVVAIVLIIAQFVTGRTRV
jgi:Family of unknown function (DUF5670)